MFERRDVLRSMLLLILILILMLTLSQILVVHRHNRHLKQPRVDKHLYALMFQLEKSIEAMMTKNVLSDKNHQALLASVYAERIKKQLVQLKIVAARSEYNDIFMNVSDTINLKHKAIARCLDNFNIQAHVTPFGSETQKLISKTTDRLLKLDEANFRNLNSINRQVMFSKMTRAHLSKTASNYENSLRNTTNWIIDSESNNSDFQFLENQKDNYTESRMSIVKQYCSEHPSSLGGPLRIDENIALFISETYLAATLAGVQLGGAWCPTECVARHRTAIVIPYRGRHKHLYVLLYYLVPMLQKQKLDFRIFVIEQYGNKTFNKGRLMNSGFKEAWKIMDFTCIIFHDVDLIPENDMNMYTCAEHPRHMSVAVDKFKYRLPYNMLVGGVLGMRKEVFLIVNGYSNLYWGWGAEDDDMAFRLKHSGFNIIRPPASIGRYTMLKHNHRETSPASFRQYLLKTVRKRFQVDGLNSLNYNVVFIYNSRFYTHIMIDIGEPPDEAMHIIKILS